MKKPPLKAISKPNKYMYLSKEIKTKEEARDFAIEWSNKQGEMSMSYGELAKWRDKFLALADEFGLEEEFKENGII